MSGKVMQLQIQCGSLLPACCLQQRWILGRDKLGDRKLKKQLKRTIVHGLLGINLSFKQHTLTLVVTYEPSFSWVGLTYVMLIMFPSQMKLFAVAITLLVTCPPCSCEKDPSINSRNPAEGISFERGVRSVICPDGRRCSEDETCCKMSSGAYGCCRLRFQMPVTVLVALNAVQKDTPADQTVVYVRRLSVPHLNLSPFIRQHEKFRAESVEHNMGVIK